METASVFGHMDNVEGFNNLGIENRTLNHVVRLDSHGTPGIVLNARWPHPTVWSDVR